MSAMVEGEPDRRRKQSLIERISEQLVPAILTAGVLGVIGFKVMEYKLVELERRSAETSAIVARHTVEITQQQERLAAATERFQAAISSIEKISDRMESRMSNMERR